MEQWTKTQKLIVIGQGYVGLPVAMTAVQKGFQVVGVDTAIERIDSLARGISYIDDVASDTLAAAIESGRYVPTDDYGQTENFDFAIITVPTPLRDSLPDLSFVKDSAKSIGSHIKPGATVILESTTHPGTTEELLVPILEQRSGLTAGKDFFVGYSPERIDPGNTRYGFINTPKVVSGINSASLTKVNQVYSALVDKTIQVSGPKEAELSKLLENTFRHVNIALVNELAMFASQLDIDIWEVIDAAATKPFGFMRFTPGPGVGGHCLPVDPSFLSWQVKKELGQNFRFVELANDVNDHMPNYVVQRIINLLSNKAKKAINGANILVIGLSYKRDTGDVRESPALKIIGLLKALGARVSAIDPHVNHYNWPADVSYKELTMETLEAADLVVIATAHSSLDLPLINKSEALIFDAQNVVSGNNVEKL